MVGAVFYDGKYILGRGYNDHRKTHPKSPHPFNTIHAEFGAFLDFGWNNSPGSVSKHVKLYVHRLKLDGSDGLAKPCQWCWGMISQLGIKDVRWSVG